MSYSEYPDYRSLVVGDTAVHRTMYASHRDEECEIVDIRGSLAIVHFDGESTNAMVALSLLNPVAR